MIKEIEYVGTYKIVRWVTFSSVFFLSFYFGSSKINIDHHEFDYIMLELGESKERAHVYKCLSTGHTY